MQRYLCSAALCVVALLAAPAMAGLSGEYTLIVYSGPSHSETAKQCIEFTQTGNIDGFPDSGTWNSPTTPDWGGNFIVDGKVLRWYGTASDGTEVTNFYNKISGDNPGKGGFDDWEVSQPPITALDDGTTRLRAGCSAPVSHSKSPTRQ